MYTKRIFIIALIISFFVTSCYKDDEDVSPPDDSEPENMEELNVPQNFDWQTTKTIDVQVTLPNNKAVNPLIITNRQVTKRYFKGYPEDNSQTVNTKITIPSYLSELRLFYNGTKGPNMATIEVDNLNYDFNTTQKSARIVNDDECDLEGFVTYSKGGWQGGSGGNGGGNSGGGAAYTLLIDHFDDVYPNGLVVGDLSNYTITFDEASDVANYLPGGGGPQVLSQSWTNPEKKDKLGNLADQVIAARLNVDYDAAGHLGSNEDYELGELVFKDGPFMNMSVNEFLDMAEIALGDGGLNSYSKKQYKNAAENINHSFHEGNNGEILTCPADEGGEDNYPFIEISSNCADPDGIFTITNTGDAEMDNLQEYHVFRNGDVIDQGTYQLGINETKEIVVSFNSPDDVMKVEVYIPEEFANEEDHMVYSELTDCVDEDDGGGGDDDENTTEQLQGTLAYEDLWPGKGDYDFNDLVIDYDFEVTKNNDEIVQDITATFEVKAFGASLHNGFGFTLPNVQPGDIASVSGYDIAGNSVFDIGANGTESGQSDATFIVFDDTYRLFASTGGTGVNTDPDYEYAEPVTLTLEIEFANNPTITYSELDIGSFKPFLVVNTIKDGSPYKRDKEVHLPGEAPTDLFDENLGSGHDDSNPSENRYFVTENNLPWGINIAEEFDWVVETKDITNAYNHFAEWAESGGINYPDWYQDNTGYRNDNLIYPTQKNIP